jgi:S1-C subfamily serine protease
VTGSGVIIDDRGVILTNAHVGQYLLLQSALPKNTVNCTIRTGSPANAAYFANLLYLSPKWVKENYKNIIEANPTGTGENDFALLYISGPTPGSSALPQSFPAISIDTSDDLIKTGDQVLALGYPAGFLGGVTINQNLYAVASVATVGELFTFHSDTFDLFSIGGTPVAQKGSSGGGVVNQKNGRLSGLIVTTTEADTTSGRNLNAVTLSHIDRSMQTQEGVGLTQFLQGSLQEKVISFYQNKAVDLAQLLVDTIRGEQ